MLLINIHLIKLLLQYYVELFKHNNRQLLKSIARELSHHQFRISIRNLFIAKVIVPPLSLSKQLVHI